MVRINSILHLLISIDLLFLFLVSGHQLNFNDFAQLRLLFEVAIFFIAGLLLQFKYRTLSNRLSFFTLIIIVIVQFSIVDLIIETMRVDFQNDSTLILVLILYSTVFSFNGHIIYRQYKRMIRNAKYSFTRK